MRVMSATASGLMPRCPDTRRARSLARATRCAFVVAMLALLAAPALGAQGTPRHPGKPPLRAARVLKWTLLAASVGLHLWAYEESNRGDEAYAELRKLCENDQPRCTLTNGEYADAHAESLYAASNTGDRHARMGLVVGQVTLLGSATFFIIDLRHGGPPDNIPYDPPSAPGGGARLRAGIRLPLP
jgi:hypothetical protein